MSKKRKSKNTNQKSSNSKKNSGTSGYKASQNRINKVILNQFTGLVSADGSGVLAVQYQANPTSSPNWSDFTAVYRDYRVMRMQLRYIPYEQYDSALSTVKTVMYTATDHRGTAVTPTATSVTSCADAMQRSNENPWHMSVRAYSGSPDQDWTNVGAPLSPAPFSIQLYTSGYAAAGPVGYFQIRYYVEFRDIN